MSIVLLEEKHERKQLQELLEEYHYLGGLQASGEQLHYAIVDGKGDKLGGFIFSAATFRLKHRDNSIGWSKEQRRRRLGLVVNNSRFLLIPEKSVPNMVSKALRIVLQRLSEDWQKKYEHPVILVETFVDPHHFNGACYSVNGWKNVGSTAGYGKASRINRDFYEFYGRPKLLFIKELVKNACRSLQAKRLRKDLLCVEAKVPPHPTLVSQEMRSLVEHFKAVPEYRDYVGFYPLFSLISIMALAHLAGAPRGGKDLAAFASA